MSILGPNDLKQFALPTYIDAAYISKYRLASGETYEQYIGEVTQALAMQNGALLSDPMVGGLISLTSEMMAEYAIGVSNGFNVATEYGRGDAQRGKTTGHMLPLIAYDRPTGWTWMSLQKARRAQLDADIASILADLRNIWHKNILARLFKSTYDSVGSGRSVPFADGGTADSAYVPPFMPDRATEFAYTHQHYAALNGITQANLVTAVKNVWEHGHDAPYELLVPQADIASWTAVATVTGFVPRASSLIRYGSTQDLANVAESYIGAVETDYGPVQMRMNARIPTGYWALYKSYGAQDQRNPLKVRYNERYGIGAILLAGDHIRTYPLENAIAFSEFGVGIGDRTAAVLIENSGDGVYTTPTIS